MTLSKMSYERVSAATFQRVVIDVSRVLYLMLCDMLQKDSEMYSIRCAGSLGQNSIDAKGNRAQGPNQLLQFASLKRKFVLLMS